jgi:hypothetical protein
MPEPSMSAPAQGRRLTVAAAVLVVMAVAGLSLIVGAQRSSGAPVAGPVARPAVAVPPSTAVTAPPPPAPAEEPFPASASTAPPTTTASTPTTTTPTTTTGARSAAATRTTSPPRARPPAPPAPMAPAGAADAGSQLKQVESLADTSGWDWRKVHVQFRIGFAPTACCHWGVYDPNDHKTIWIGPTAFGDATRLRYVVLHELAHAWQWHSHRLKKLSADMAPWGYSDLDALEAGADCIATDWGADAAAGHYWTCPPDARALMAQRLAGQWK